MKNQNKVYLPPAKQLGFSEIQAELTNLPILPNLPNKAN